MVPLRPAAVCAALGVSWAFVVWAQEPPRLLPNHPFAGWTHIELEGRKYLVGSAKATFDRWPAATEQPELVQVTTRAGVFGSGTERFTWVQRDPVHELLWRSFSLVPGEKARVIRATEARRICATRFDPPKREPKADPSRWKPREPQRYLVAEPNVPLLEPYLLLAHLDRLLDGKTPRVAIAGKERVTIATIRLDGERTDEIPVRDSANGRTRRIPSRQVRLVLAPERDDDEAMLSLVGPLSIWVDRDTGIPAEIDGRHESVGTIKLRLTAAWQASAPRPSRVWPTSPAADALCAPAAGG